MSEVYKAISAVQGELAKTGISKGKTNQQQGFKYRGIDDVYNELASLLATHHLCILPRMVEKNVVERTNSKGTALFYTSITAEFDLVSAKDGSKHTVSAYGEAMDSGDKSAGKAMSYAYKAMAFMTFAIPTEGDNDPDAHCHEVKPRQTAPKPAEQPPATGPDAEYQQRIKTALHTIFGADKKAALDKVEELTSFIPKGKTEAERVKGVRDFTKLTGQRLTILAHNLEKMLPKQDAPEICAECHQPTVNGACRNLSCPEGRPE